MPRRVVHPAIMTTTAAAPLRICHITPHLPPDQAANALLPAHLGQWAITAGHEVSFVAHPPRQSQGAPLIPATYLPSRHRDARVLGSMKLASLLETVRIQRDVGPVLDRADVVHVHSNGLLAEAGGLLALRLHKPVVFTLYGTEIWHYAPKRGIDLFTRLYRRATRVTFYSGGLKDHAVGAGLDRAGLSVVYPPVADAFTFIDSDAQTALRAHLGIAARRLIVNVKRLHPLAGQRYLIEAMPAILAAHPDTHLVICGTGALAADLEMRADALGVRSHVTFTGLIPNQRVAQYVAAADLFVLPSLLEALPTVAVEALASGTPVVSADHPGGLELQRLFGDDVGIVPRERAQALAEAVSARLSAPRRTLPGSRTTLETEFRPAIVLRRYLDLYRAAIADVRR
jgi:phosphatidylinositol alpha-1,6-mannosyltransferase